MCVLNSDGIYVNKPKCLQGLFFFRKFVLGPELNIQQLEDIVCLAPYIVLYLPQI